MFVFELTSSKTPSIPNGFTDREWLCDSGKYEHFYSEGNTCVTGGE